MAAPRAVELFAGVTDPVGVVELRAFGGELLGGEVSQLQHGAQLVRGRFGDREWFPAGACADSEGAVGLRVDAAVPGVAFDTVHGGGRRVGAGCHGEAAVTGVVDDVVEPVSCVAMSARSGATTLSVSDPYMPLPTCRVPRMFWGRRSK